jgi:hypothetical protein
LLVNLLAGGQDGDAQQADQGETVDPNGDWELAGDPVYAGQGVGGVGVGGGGRAAFPGARYAFLSLEFGKKSKRRDQAYPGNMFTWRHLGYGGRTFCPTGDGGI